jgi:hypothetical protein
MFMQFMIQTVKRHECRAPQAGHIKKFFASFSTHILSGKPMPQLWLALRSEPAKAES